VAALQSLQGCKHAVQLQATFEDEKVGVTMSQCHFVTALPCHYVAVSLLCRATTSLCHFDTPSLYALYLPACVTVQFCPHSDGAVRGRGPGVARGAPGRTTTPGHPSAARGIPEAEAQRVMRAVAGLLHRCHSLGLAHRRLQAQSVLLLRAQEGSPVKVGGFSAAVFLKPGEDLYHSTTGLAIQHSITSRYSARHYRGSSVIHCIVLCSAVLSVQYCTMLYGKQ